MKRFLLSILIVVIGLTAFSQSPSRLVTLQPAYPLAIGGNVTDGVSLESNCLDLQDIVLDSLSQYEIGYIDVQTVRYSGIGHGFYVKADSLHSLDVTFSCEVSENSEQPQGTIEFNQTTGLFKYFPQEDEFKSFMLIFSATNGTETISENVLFNVSPCLTSEAEVFSSKGIMPDASDFITIAVASKSMTLNNYERSARSVSISGKDVIFDDAVHNKVWGLSGSEDIYELNIFAERLIVRNALRFPQTNITVYAKEFIFEDRGNEKASINTTPTPIETLENGKGKNGANAGNINLYVKDFKGDMAIRFILNGAPGQSTNRNGTPGNGGNGGTFCSTLDLTSYCDFARGSCGMKYDVVGDGSIGYGPVIAYGNVGENGHFEQSGKSYLHPSYVAAVILHANEAFINNYTDYALQICHEYRMLIDVNLGGSNEVETVNGLSDGTDNDDIDAGRELRNNLMEINAMLNKLEQGLDYFGNPAGWVPLLSFEGYLMNYENEIDRAIPTLYMYYWMNRVDQTLQNMVSASQEAASLTEKEIDEKIELLNSLQLEIPVIQDEVEEIIALVTELNSKLTVMQNILMAKAKKNVKKRERNNKMFNIGKSLANVLSVVYSPILGATISAGLDIAGSNNNDTDVDYSSVLNSFMTTINISNALQKNAEEAKKKAKETGGNNNGGGDNNNTNEGWESACVALFQKSEPLLKSFAETAKILSQNTVSDKAVQGEFDKLKGKLPWFKQMEDSLNVLDAKKNNLLNHMNMVSNQIVTTVSELSNDVLALDAFLRNVFTGNSKRDLNAMLYIAKLEQRAKKRLLKYDYYLRKAYEYRLLKPYEGEEFNLNDMYDRFEKLGMALDSVVDVAAYNALSAVYKGRVSDMIESIVEEYTYNQSERSNNVPVTIPKEILDAINANESVTLNLYELDNGSYFFQDEENLRIVNLGVKYIKAHAVGNASRSRLGVDIKHSGMSQFRKNGQVYWFDHMSRQSDNPHYWRTTINFSDFVEETNPETHQNSVAISSLLSAILNNNNEAIMLFSRPAVWSDITLSKLVQTNGNDILIDSLVLELQYDYTLRPDNIRNIDIIENNELMPYIACTSDDVTGLSGGNAPLYRSFRTSSQSVMFTATDKYETYYFVNWTDQAGNQISDNPALTVNRQKDQFYVANYERRVPILNVADTIKVGYDRGTYTVNVSNVGSGDTEMDWYVEDSIKTGNWVHLGGVVEGIDSGSFTFTCDENKTGKTRVDSLEIFAPETDAMSKVIYIVQSNLLKGDVNIDGSVDVADIASTIDVMAGIGGQTQVRADVNGDGMVDVADIAAIIDIMAAWARQAGMKEE